MFVALIWWGATGCFSHLAENTQYEEWFSFWRPVTLIDYMIVPFALCCLWALKLGHVSHASEREGWVMSLCWWNEDSRVEEGDGFCHGALRWHLVGILLASCTLMWHRPVRGRLGGGVSVWVEALKDAWKWHSCKSWRMGVEEFIRSRVSTELIYSFSRHFQSNFSFSK